MEKNNFEDNMRKLEEIVQVLENGELNLEDSIGKFEEGIKISKECNEYLENAEKKISILIQNHDGTMNEEEFNN